MIDSRFKNSRQFILTNDIALSASALLPTVLVYIATEDGHKHCIWALIDQVSQCSLVAKNLAHRLTLPRTSVCVPVSECTPIAPRGISSFKVVSRYSDTLTSRLVSSLACGSSSLVHTGTATTWALALAKPNKVNTTKTNEHELQLVEGCHHHHNRYLIENIFSHYPGFP